MKMMMMITKEGGDKRQKSENPSKNNLVRRECGSRSSLALYGILGVANLGGHTVKVRVGVCEYVSNQ